MKLEQAHIEQIRTAFQKMQSKEDLLHLLNDAKPFVYGEKAVPFQLKQLTWYSNPKLAKKRYIEFKIKKKSGVDRTINAPVEGLKSIQKTLSFVLQCVFEPHKAAMGFVRKKSIVDNAKIHAGSRYVYNIDLKDFFPSIDQARVWKCLQLKPFNLNDKNKEVEEKVISKIYSFDEIKEVFKFTHARLLDTKKVVFLHLIKFIDNKESYISIKIDDTISFTGETIDAIVNDLKKNYVIYSYVTENGTFLKLIHSKDVKNKAQKLIISRLLISNIIASLCCTEMEVERKNDNGEWEKVKRNVLPQGAPTSPIITNVICHRMDYLLTAVAKRFGLKYSRYADDMTFSSMHNVFQQDSEFLKELYRIIFEQGFQIKESKTRLQKEGFRQEVTGLVVNEKVNVQKRYIKQLREWLYKWETYGYNKANSFFIQNYVKEKGNVKKGIPSMTMVLDGKLQYLKMVKGDNDGAYVKLKERFDALYGKISPINSILDIWENEGIDKAMEVFYLQNPNKSTGEVATNKQLDIVFNDQFDL